MFRKKRQLQEYVDKCARLEKEINENKDKLNEMCQQQENLLKENERLLKDNERVYSGHRSMEEEINFLKFRISTLDELHESIVQQKWPHDGSMKKYKCMYPYERVEILPRGEVYTCCSGYVKHNYYIGNIYEDNFDNIWNSEKALKLRFSVSNGNFEYCQKVCKWLHKENIENKVETATTNPIVERSEEDVVDNWRECQLTKYPKYITLTCDDSCNLSCPTCRSKNRVMTKQEGEKLLESLNTVVKPMLRDCELLGGLASGDLFASWAVSNFYKSLHVAEFPNLKLYILTNLQLLTEDNWKKNYSNLHEFEIRLGVSIDAANKETYEINRRGGTWETLCENLEFVKRWRMQKPDNIKFLCLHFVIQKNNYLQIEEFIKFGEKYGADTVEFQQLGNWGTFSQEEYAERNVLDEKHELHEEVIRILEEVLSKEWGVTIVQNIV